MKRKKLSQLNRKLRVFYFFNRFEFENYTKNNICPNASTMYRALLPMVFINASEEMEFTIGEGIFYDTEKDDFPVEKNPILKFADVVVFPRFTAMENGIHVKLIKKMKSLGIVIGFEHDDNYWEFNRGCYGTATISSEQIALTRETVKLADFIISPNHFLNSETIRHTGATPRRTFAIPNSIIVEEWEEAKSQRKEHDKVNILLAGASNHYPDWIRMYPTLRRIVTKNKDKVTINFLGIQNYTLQVSKDKTKYPDYYEKDVRELLGYIDKLGATMYGYADFTLYPQMMNRLSPDIGLIITSGDNFDRSKSSLKFIDYTMAGAAIVCSRQQPYTDEITDEEVMFAGNQTEWLEKMQMLIDNEQLRKDIVARAEKKVRENYSIKKNYKLWVKAFEEAYKAVNG